MKQILTFSVVVAALVIGAFAGFHYASHRYAGAVTATIASYEFLRASDTLTTLHDLRAGDTNAVFDSLEGQLDTSAISLRGILDDDPTAEHAASYTNVLRGIADYRVAYPPKKETR